jgi:hypothetical protein
VALGYVEDAFEARTPLVAFFSILLDGVVGEAQVQDAAESSLFRMEETGKAKPDPFDRTGTHNSAVDHDGIIVFGRMEFQHDLTAHRNTLLRKHTAPSERQIRDRPFHNDTCAGIVDGANLCRILYRNSVIVAARVRLELAKEGRKTMGTELTAKGIDGKGAEQTIGDTAAWCKSSFQCPTSWALAGAHGL